MPTYIETTTRNTPMQWTDITAGPDAPPPPSPITMRVQSIGARERFAAHAHAWGQVVYAVSGVLSVVADGQAFALSSNQAAWIPAGTGHSVGSFLGAHYHSLWLADVPGGALSARGVAVFGVSALLKALIIEAAKVCGLEEDRAYADRVHQLMFDQLRRAQPVSLTLAWPTNALLATVCETLCSNPADARGPDEWGRELGMSGRTLARKFLVETGQTFRAWRRRLRLLRAIELLQSGADVTRTALELGYGSTSAFVFAFRSDMHCSPMAYVRARSP